MKSTSVYIYTVGKATERTTDDYDLDDMIVSKAAAKKNEELEDVRRLNRAAADQLAEGGSNVKFIRPLIGSSSELWNGSGSAWIVPPGSGSRRVNLKKNNRQNAMKLVPVIIIISLKLSKFGPAPWFSTCEQSIWVFSTTENYS